MFIFCSRGPLNINLNKPFKWELHKSHVDYVDYVEIALSGMREGANNQCLYSNVMNVMKAFGWTL